MPTLVLCTDSKYWPNSLLATGRAMYDLNESVPFGYIGARPPVDEDIFDEFWNHDKYSWDEVKDLSYEFVAETDSQRIINDTIMRDNDFGDSME